jgi:UDP-N-acetylmuramoylalanine--D-glutamate ligase
MLVAAQRQAHLVGNIGVSSLEMLAQYNTVEDVYVVETSSYQARLLDRGPGIAVLTELFPEHIDYHGSVEEYYRDKLRVTTMQSELQLLIYNAASAELRQRVDQSVARQLGVPGNNVSEGAQCRDEMIFFDGDEIAPRSDCKLLGEHNTKNILLAVTAAKQLRVENEAIAQALKLFKPLPHRLELIGTYKGVTFVNDSLATTPEATLAALQSLENVQTIFLG